MSDLSQPSAWAVPGGHGSVSYALTKVQARLGEASRCLRDDRGIHAIQSAIAIVTRVQQWVDEHEVRQQVQHPPCNKSRWD